MLQELSAQEIKNRLNNVKIDFEEETHTYTINAKKCVSVTTLLDKLTKRFDNYSMALSSSKNYEHELFGINPDEIIEIWTSRNQLACTRGTNIHLYCEAVINNENTNELIKNVPIDISNAFLNFYSTIILPNLECSIAVEQRLGSEKLGLAGTCDWLPFFKEFGLFIFDWKTNQKMSVESDFKLSYPFNYLDNSKLTIYTLQTHIYRYLLEVEYDIKTSGERIIWINEKQGVISYKPKFSYSKEFTKKVIDVCLERYHKN